MAKPKGPPNPKTGNKTPAQSFIEITEKAKPSSLELQLQQLKLDKESKKQKIQEAQEELNGSSKQETQLEGGIAWLAKRLARDREINDKRREEEKQKKPKTVVLGPKVGIKRYIFELTQGECTIEFYKKTSRPSGEFRKMRCTLKDKNVIPQNPLKPGIVTVWDLDKSNWRSFYHNRISKLIRNEQTDSE